MPPKHKEMDKQEILNLLNRIDLELEGIQKKIKLYCVGGTILVLSGQRTVSKDVDFIVDRADFRTISGCIAEADWKNHIQVDLFQDGHMPKYQYKEYQTHAKEAPFLFKNIQLYFLDTIDLILTKAIAGRSSDYEDIRRIAPSPAGIPKDELLNRFKNIKPNAGESAEIERKFNKFISDFYKT